MLEWEKKMTGEQGRDTSDAQNNVRVVFYQCYLIGFFFPQVL